MVDIKSIVINYKSILVKIEAGKIFLQAFGTTIQNPYMHVSWIEVPKDKLSIDLIKHLQESKLI